MRQMMYSEEEARRLVVLAGKEALKAGLVARTWGNISARISDEEFVITPSGRAYEDLEPQDLVKCRIDDCSHEGPNKPSSEKGIHADCYRLRPDVNFVIHTHQFYATAVGVTGRSIKKPHIPCARYGMPSTKKLRKNVALAVEENPDCKAFLMEKHGALCLGGSYEESFAEANRLERICRKRYFKRLERTVSRETLLGRRSLRNLSFSPRSDIIDAVEGKETILVSSLGRTMHPAIDDLVQINGLSVHCVGPFATEAAKKRALRGHTAVFVRGRGALTVGEDSEAVASVLRKGCAAALYKGDLKGMNPVDAFIQRTVYRLKYSKEKRG